MRLWSGYEAVWSGYETMWSGYETMWSGYEAVWSGYETMWSEYEGMWFYIQLCGNVASGAVGRGEWGREGGRAMRRRGTAGIVCHARIAAMS